MLTFVAGLAPFPKLSGLSLAQTSSGEQNEELLHLTQRHDHVAPTIPQLEQQQIDRYTNQPDDNVVFKDGKIDSFYGITRAEVLALPGRHPYPDVYTQFQFRNKQGTLQSCCSGNDCRPAILRMLGGGMVAVGVHFEVDTQHTVLFFKVHVSETNIVSTETLSGGNPEYTRHKYHACVYQGRLYCAGFPVEG